MIKGLLSRLSFSNVLTNAIRLILIVQFISAFSHDRTLAMAFSIIAFIATFIPKILNNFGLRTGVEMQVVILMIIYGSLFLGEVQNFLPDGDLWDILLRSVAALALSLIGLTIILTLEKEELLDASPFMIVLLSFSISFTLGALWELMEFTLDSTFGFYIQSLGTSSTSIDLAISALASLFVSIWGYLYTRYTGRSLLSSSIIKWMQSNPQLFRSKKYLEISSEKIKSIISAGEGPKLEFKSSLRTNIYTNQIDKSIEFAVLKTLVAYMNTDGGTLMVGVSDKGEILGLEKDAFTSNDKLKLHLNNMIKEHIGTQFSHFIQYELFPINDRHILKIDCLPSTKRVFLKDGKEEEFYIRNGPASTKLTGNALIDYIGNRFK
ncbi:MAG: helix-turn-helix domain-containing protein [Candidatus Pacearchaeota archaeon]